MTPEERQQSLTNARRAARWLRDFLAFELPEALKQEVDFLIKGFEILDAKERKQAEAGRKSGHLGGKHGHKGGRPKKPTASSRSAEQEGK